MAPAKTGKSRETKVKAIKDPNAPKKPPSAYLLFSNSIRADVKKKNPNDKPTDLMRKLGALWKALENKTEWEIMAKDAKVTYDEAVRNYNGGQGGSKKDVDKSKKRPAEKKNEKKTAKSSKKRKIESSDEEENGPAEAAKINIDSSENDEDDDDESGDEGSSD